MLRLPRLFPHGDARLMLRLPRFRYLTPTRATA
jgi:hypothetical protein